VSTAMPRSLIALSLALLLGLPSFALASPQVDTSQVPQFKTEPAAQRHCPGDTVVWLNTYSGIWHYKGAKYWMNTKYGAFACEQEAGKLGMRASRDGS
jgi:hypothetical protein